MSENNVYPKAAAGEQSANVAPNPSFPKLEESVLDYWEKDDTFQKSIERRPSGDHSQNEFVLPDHEGPQGQSCVRLGYARSAGRT